jgi:hypothetical protein
MNGFWNSRSGHTLIVTVVGGVAVYLITKHLLPKVGEAVNPLSDQNLAYKGTNAVGAALTGDPSWSLGSWLYDRFNPPYDPNAPAPSTRKQQVTNLANHYAQFAPSAMIN